MKSFSPDYFILAFLSGILLKVQRDEHAR